MREIDPNISDEEFGRIYLAGRGQKAARRCILKEGIQYQIEGRHWMLKLSAAEAWRNSRTITPEQQPNLKALLKEIEKRVLKTK